MSGTTAQTRKGGCGFCRHLRRGRCRHPAYPVPVDYHEARGRGQPCGERAVLWEYYGDG